MPEKEPYITIQEVSEITGIAVSTLRNYKKQGTGPPYYDISPKIIWYLESDVREWIKTHKKEGGEQ